MKDALPPIHSVLLENLGLGAHLFVKKPRPGVSEVTFSVFRVTSQWVRFSLAFQLSPVLLYGLEWCSFQSTNLVKSVRRPVS